VKLRPGLASITFRQLSPSTIVELRQQACLQGIKRGSAMHVPCDNKGAAKETRKLTEKANLEVIADGSYYYLAGTGHEPFGKVLETATTSGAPIIRVWACVKGSAETYAGACHEVVDGLKRICDLAPKAKLTLALVEKRRHSSARLRWQSNCGKP
jgi:hypothetical protein